MKRISLTEAAHQIVRQHLQLGELAIDATLGNGYDTVFLAQCVGGEGHVFGFDIQRQALDNTRQRLHLYAMEQRCTLFLGCHSVMQLHLPEAVNGNIKAIMFNLGYLPGSDKALITQSETTLTALNTGCGLLAKGGVITLLAYPGHAGGDLECRQIRAWGRQLDRKQFQFEVIISRQHQAKAPLLFVIRRPNDLL